MHPRRAATLAILAAALVTLGLASTASADHLYTKERTAIRDRPGEQARVVVRVGPNREVEVLGHKGRWIKVKYQGKVGWLTRTTVRKTAHALSPAERRARVERERARLHRKRRLGRPAHPNARHSKTRGHKTGSARAAHKGGSARAAHKGGSARAAHKGGSMKASSGTGAHTAQGASGGAASATHGGMKRSSWGGKHTPGGPLNVRVDVPTAKALASADTSAAVAFTAKQGQVVRAVGHNGDWIEIQNQAGKKGWVTKNDVSDPGDLVQARANIRPAHPTPVPGGGLKKSAPVRKPSRSKILLSAGAAYSSVGLDFTSDAASANATVSGQAVGLGLQGTYVYHFSPRILLAGDVSYMAGKGISGFDYKSMAQSASGVGFDLYDVGLGGSAGYRFGRLAVWLRIGAAYNSLYVTDLANSAKMPREQVLGGTAGVGVTTHFGKLSAAARFDYMPIGSRSQTKGLEDGTKVDSLSGMWGTAMLSYPLTGRYAVDARYQFQQMSTSWSGASARISGGMSAKRTDTTNLVLLGVGAAF